MSPHSVTRRPAVSGRFYPATERACRDEIEQARAAGGPDTRRARGCLGGIAPHAGWAFCARPIARVFDAIAAGDAETLIHFGAVHVPGCRGPSVYAAGTWRTPLGDLPVDDEFARALLENHPDLFIDDADVHAREHSLEVQLPFAQTSLAGGLRIVPIMAPPSADTHRLGEAAAAVSGKLGRRSAAVGSTDLTHYGATYYGWAPKGEGDAALKWVREENDRRIVDLMLAMDAEAIHGEAIERRNACGPGAVAATIAFCRALGASEGTLLDYTTSHDELPRGVASDFVGYAGIVFG